MARKPRIVADGSYHHIIHRGNNRMKVFRDASDYNHFCLLLKTYLSRYPACIYHYCLMPNHLHILLQIKIGKQLQKLMQGVGLSYSIYCRKKYDFVGSLWQGRYKSIPIENDGYLMECGRYIERNPLRAKIVEDPGEYRFSSYGFYAHGDNSPLITEDILYEAMGSNAQERQKRYREYIMQGRPYETLIHSALRLEKCPLGT